jgi:ribosome maturation factor RimP
VREAAGAGADPDSPLPRRALTPFKSAPISAIIRADNDEKWAGHSPFFFGRVGLHGVGARLKLGELLEKTVPPLGYELVDWETTPGGRLVRVFIDKPNGVDVEDCARVSEHLTRLFAVENVDFDRLEVSSPGLDRALKKAADFIRFEGSEADLKLATPVDNARRMKGVLRGCDGETVRVETKDGMRAIPLANITRARLVPKIEWRKA